MERIPDLTPTASDAPADFEVALVSLNQWQLAWRRFRRHKLAMFGAGLFLTIRGDRRSSVRSSCRTKRRTFHIR